MTVTDLQRQQAKTPRHTTKTKTGVKAASNTSILTGGKACTKVSISYLYEFTQPIVKGPQLNHYDTYDLKFDY